MVNGRLLVNGVPLEQTEVWKNEKRFGPSTLPAMLDAAGFQSIVIGLDTVRGNLEVFRSTLEAVVGVEKRAVVCDAETENDLAGIAQATVLMTRRCLLVGSAGLMRHLPKAHGLSGSVGLSHERKRNQSLPVLTIVGSIASASRQQCQHVAKTAETVVYTIDPQVLREGSTHSQWRECQQYVLDSLARKEDTVVTIGGESPDLSEGPLLAAALARLVHPALDLLGGLILTGGETARALLSGWGMHTLELIGELEAGVPLSCISGQRFIPVITKAGAFGSEGCLSRAFQLLKSDF